MGERRYLWFQLSAGGLSELQMKYSNEASPQTFELPLGIAPDGRSQNLTQHEQVYGNQKSKRVLHTVDSTLMLVSG